MRYGVYLHFSPFLNICGNQINLSRDPFYGGHCIAQTTITLGIAQIARALTGLDASIDLLDRRAGTSHYQFSADRAGRVAEAITDEHILIPQVLLVYPLAQIGFAERLLSIG